MDTYESHRTGRKYDFQLLVQTHNGHLGGLDVLPHLLQLALQLVWRFHNLRLELADVLLQVADVHLHLGLVD